MRVRNRLLVASIAAALVLPAMSAGASPQTRISKAPQPLEPVSAGAKASGHRESVPGELLVTFKHGRAPELKRQGVHRAVGAKRAGRGHSVTADTELVQLESGVSAAKAKRDYLARPEVEAVQPNYVYHVSAVPNDPRFHALWALNNTGQTGGTADADADVLEAWDKSTGSGVVVAVTDSGVDLDHPDLVPRLWTNPGEIAGNGIDDDSNGVIDDIHGAGFVGSGAPTGTPSDTYGHGTHVAGTVAAQSNNATGVAGVAPGARVMAVQIGDSVGAITSADAIQGINYAADNGADVINASWGGLEDPDDPGPDPALDQAIANAGVLFVTTAGNDGTNNDVVGQRFYPASSTLPNIIAVGATDHKDARPYWSGYGKTSVDLAAPGVGILSTYVPAGEAKYFYDFSSLSGWSNMGDPGANWSLTTKRFVTAPYSVGTVNYPADRELWLVKTGTLDLSAGTDWRVSLDWLSELQPTHRVGILFRRTVDSDWQWLQPTDTGGAWTTTGAKLPDILQGQPSVQVALWMDSTGNPASSAYEGAFVDNLAVYRPGHGTDHSLGYKYLQGTSMAAPHVAGAAALALAAKPTLTTAQLKSVLLGSTDPVSSYSGKSVTGGRLNAWGAVTLAQGGSLGAPVTRLAGADRYEAAVSAAKAGSPGWAGVDHVVLASGEDRAAADPLAAAGLTWAYDRAPLMLVSSTDVPRSVEKALKEIVAANPAVTIHLVGGTVSVPNARKTEIVNALGSSASKVTFDRVSGPDRYRNAAAIAARMRAVRPGGTSAVLVANGADSDKFFDALALAPIAAKTGAPVLLVTKTSVPSATSSEIAKRAPSRRVVGGGPATVSDAVVKSLSAERWSGSTRYTTASTIATKALAAGWLGAQYVGVAAKLPDALSGGAMVGGKGGPLLITESNKLTSTTKSWLAARSNEVTAAYVFGGTKSVSESVRTEIANTLSRKP